MLQLKKHLFVGLGFIFLAIGIIGIFLPILPTTPFALLAAYLFGKSSPKFYKWCLSLPVIGPAIVDWNQYQRVSKKSKAVASVTITATVAFVWSRPTIPIAVKIAATAVQLYILVFVNTRNSR